MDDRELLEKAARAAGLKVAGLLNPSGLMIEYAPGRCKDWNPLEDDGDALRLAVKLSLRFDCDAIERATIAMGIPTRSAVENHRDDPYAASRRVIVRAAAAMAKEG